MKETLTCCHSSACIVSFIHLEMVGSRKARETLATTRAPAQHATWGSTSRRQMGVASGRTYLTNEKDLCSSTKYLDVDAAFTHPSSTCLAFMGRMMSRRRKPSIRQTKARMIKGNALPARS